MSEKSNEIWTWYIDEEGMVLKSPSDERYYNYDKFTNEIKIEPSSQWYNTTGDSIPHSNFGELSFYEAGEAYVREKFSKEKNIYFASEVYKTTEDGDIKRKKIKLPEIDPSLEIKFYDIEKSIRNDFLIEYFKDVKNPSFQKLHYPEKIAVIDDMVTNIDWLGEYKDKTGKQTGSLPLSYVKDTIEHKDLNNRYTYFDMNNAGQYRHYSEVINEWKERNPHINDKLITKEHEDTDKNIQDNISYTIRKNLEGEIFVSDFNNEKFENENIKNHDESFRYSMLDRMKTDCDYYLGNGNRNKEKLWSCDETQQIKNMISLYRSFGVKGQPEWLPVEELNNYSRQLTGKNIDEIMKETLEIEKKEKPFLDESAVKVFSNIMLKDKNNEPYFYGITHYGLRELTNENDPIRQKICQNINNYIKENNIGNINSSDINNIMDQMIEDVYVKNHEKETAKQPDYIFKTEHLDKEIQEGEKYIAGYNEYLGMWGIVDKEKNTFAPYKDLIDAYTNFDILENPQNYDTVKYSEIEEQRKQIEKAAETTNKLADFLIETVEKRKKQNEQLPQEIIDKANTLIPAVQFKSSLEYTKGEEGNFYKEKIKEIASVIDNAPKLYETDGLDEHPIALRYFHPTGTEVLICELGKNGEAFGYTVLNGDYQMSEFGYRDINEIKNIKGMELDYYLPKNMSVERLLYQHSPEDFPQYKTFDDELDRYIRLEAARVKFINEENEEGIEYPEEKEEELLKQLQKVPYDEVLEKMELQTPAFNEYPKTVLGENYFSDKREWSYLHDALYEMINSHCQSIRQENSAEYLEKAEQKAFLKKHNDSFEDTVKELNQQSKIIETEKKLEENLNNNQKNEIIKKASLESEKTKQINNEENNNNNKGKKY